MMEINKMPRASKYYTDEQLAAKIQELEAKRAELAAVKKEKLDMAKIAYMDRLIQCRKDDPKFQESIKINVEKMISELSPRKDKKLIDALKEFALLFS